MSHWCRVRNLRQWSRCPSSGQRGGRSAESCPNFGRAAAASSCPNLGQLPRVSCYKMLPRRGSNVPTPVPYAHRCTVSSYSSIGRGSSCKQCVWIPTQARRRQSSRKRLRDLRFFKVFAPVRQALYIADNFSNIASCPDGGQLPALSAAPGWACGGFYSSGVPFLSGVGLVASAVGLAW